MNQGIVVINYCIDCNKHQWCTNHDEKKYKERYEKIKRKIESECPKIQVIANQENPLVLTGKARRTPLKKLGFPKIGSFEVYFRGKTVYSKLSTARWPLSSKILDSIKDICKDNIEKKDSYSDQEVSKKALSSKPSARNRLIKSFRIDTRASCIGGENFIKMPNTAAVNQKRFKNKKNKKKKKRNSSQKLEDGKTEHLNVNGPQNINVKIDESKEISEELKLNSIDKNNKNPKEITEKSQEKQREIHDSRDIELLLNEKRSLKLPLKNPSELEQKFNISTTTPSLVSLPKTIYTVQALKTEKINIEIIPQKTKGNFVAEIIAESEIGIRCNFEINLDIKT